MPARRRPFDRALAFVIAALFIVGCSTDHTITPSASPDAPNASLSVDASPTPSPFGGFSALALAQQRIKHVVFVMQENRSFDSYFGTYPGADGIPMNNGVPSVCVPDPKSRGCVAPFHDSHAVNLGGPHHAAAAKADVDGGRMDGFVREAEAGKKNCKSLLDPACSRGGLDVMGYHDRSDIPNYWAYADNFVLEDHMFEPNASWSLPEHLFLVSEWSAKEIGRASCRERVLVTV